MDQCDVLAEPISVRRAGQLNLHDRGGSVAVPMGPIEDTPTASPAPVAPTKPRTPLAPPTRDAQRILSLAPALTSTARAYDLDPLLLHAIAHVESRHNADAVSKAGARGVMQVMPATAKRFGVTDPERTLHDADTNLRASAALLQTLFKRYGDDTRLVLAAYNAGEGAVDKFGRNVPPYPETQGYVRDVMAAHRRLSTEFAVTAEGTLVNRRHQQ
jgi:soluble lytic murein transglycosylase-like protein